MSRKSSGYSRDILPDPVFGSQLVAKLMNYVMERGKKTIAEKLVYQSFDIIKSKMNLEPLDVFRDAVNNVRPTVEVRSRRVGGATYQVPTEVREVRSISLALRWLISSAKTRGGKSMIEKLANEIMDAYNNRGGAITNKQNKIKMAEANKAFSHYRW